MIADSLDELHAMAETIGLRRGWFQKHAVMPHYDLTPNKRKQAVHHGAIEINAAQMVAELQKRRFHASDNPDAEWDEGYDICSACEQERDDYLESLEDDDDRSDDDA